MKEALSLHLTLERSAHARLSTCAVQGIASFIGHGDNGEK